MISLGAGAPSAAYFPFKELQVKLSEQPGIQAENGHESMIRMSKYDFEPGVSDYSKSNDEGKGSGGAWTNLTDRSLRLGCCLKLWPGYRFRTDATICDGTYRGMHISSLT